MLAAVETSNPSFSVGNEPPGIKIMMYLSSQLPTFGRVPGTRSLLNKCSLKGQIPS